MIDLLWCDGTWSTPTSRSAVSDALRRTMDGSRVRFVYVDYPATYGPATGVGDESFGDSVGDGVQALARAVEASPNLAIVGGYSQGAAVAVDYARTILPTSPLHEVLAVVALGNPHQPTHLGRSGIAGPLDVPRPLVSVYAPGDPIADLPGGSPLRTIADVTEWMSLRSLEDAHRWAVTTAEKVAKARLQAWWKPWRWQDLNSAQDYALEYLLGTAHTTDYVDGGHVERLARRIEALA